MAFWVIILLIGNSLLFIKFIYIRIISILTSMANKVTTEWFDIQVKHGNYIPLEKETTLYEEQKIMQ